MGDFREYHDDPWERASKLLSGFREPPPHVPEGVYGPLGTWRCKDGRVLRVADLEDRHLANAYAMLFRRLALARKRNRGFTSTFIEHVTAKHNELGRELTRRRIAHDPVGVARG